MKQMKFCTNNSKFHDLISELRNPHSMKSVRNQTRRPERATPGARSVVGLPRAQAEGGSARDARSSNTPAPRWAKEVGARPPQLPRGGASGLAPPTNPASSRPLGHPGDGIGSGWDGGPGLEKRRGRLVRRKEAAAVVMEEEAAAAAGLAGAGGLSPHGRSWGGRGRGECAGETGERQLRDDGRGQ